MHNVGQLAPEGLWTSCVYNSGRVVFFDRIIHQDDLGTSKPVYDRPTFTSGLAHFLYSVFPSLTRLFAPVSEVLVHTIHSTYNYILFGKKNTFIIKRVDNEEAS